MAIIITDECINCGACEPECPNNAIYEGGAEWRLSDGTSLHGMQTMPTGNSYDADQAQTPVAMDIYYIVPDKCTECTGFHDEPQCAAVCPVDCCVDDPDHRETKEEPPGQEGVHAPVRRPRQGNPGRRSASPWHNPDDAPHPSLRHALGPECPSPCVHA